MLHEAIPCAVRSQNVVGSTSKSSLDQQFPAGRVEKAWLGGAKLLPHWRLPGRGRSLAAIISLAGIRWASHTVSHGDMDSGGMVDATFPAPWMRPLRDALNHGGTRRKKRDRREARRKHVQLATVDPFTGRPAVRTISFRGFLTPAHLRGAGTVEDLPLHQESCALIFATDDRAEKIRHLADPDRAFVECCWWLDEAGIQFRLAGRALVAGSSHCEGTGEYLELHALRAEVWRRMTPSTRRTFMWPEPGAPLGSGVSAAIHSAHAAADDANVATDEASDDAHFSEEPPCGAEGAYDTANDNDGSDIESAHFAVVLVVPHAVDELHLGGRQRRLRYSFPERDKNEASVHPGLRRLFFESAADWVVEALNP